MMKVEMMEGIPRYHGLRTTGVYLPVRYVINLSVLKSIYTLMDENIDDDMWLINQHRHVNRIRLHCIKRFSLHGSIYWYFPMLMLQAPFIRPLSVCDLSSVN